jgi:hypothetical protein
MDEQKLGVRKATQLTNENPIARRIASHDQSSGGVNGREDVGSLIHG